MNRFRSTCSISCSMFDIAPLYPNHKCHLTPQIIARNRYWGETKQARRCSHLRVSCPIQTPNLRFSICTTLISYNYRPTRALWSVNSYSLNATRREYYIIYKLLNNRVTRTFIRWFITLNNITQIILRNISRVEKHERESWNDFQNNPRDGRDDTLTISEKLVLLVCNVCMLKNEDARR